MKAPIPLPRSARPGGYPAPKPAFDWKRALPFAGEALSDFGYGLAKGGFDDAFGIAAERGAQLQPGRDAQRKAEKKQTESEAYLEANFPVLWQKFKAGAPMEAVWNAALKGDSEGYTLGEGDRRFNSNNELVAEGPAVADGGPYAGTGMDAQNWNILLKGSTGDPAVLASPEYAAAYAQQTQPQVTYQQTENGMVPVMTTPQIPAWMKPPLGMGQGAPPTPGQAQMPGQAPMPGASPVPSQSGPTVGAPLPGTQRPSTETETRIGMLSDTILNEVPTVHASMEAVSDSLQQIIAIGGDLTNVFQSEDFQRGQQAISTSAGAILYALSGAAAGDEETEKRIRDVTPKFGDKPGAIRDRLRRFDNYVMTLANASGDPEKVRLAQQAMTQARNGALRRAATAPRGAPAPGGGAVDDILRGYGL